MKAPNVLVLISHDTGRHISTYGINSVNTPNFEKLASESVQFDNAFCCTPQCSPARAALFSGRYPHSVGVMGNVGREHGWRFPDHEVHASQLFRNNDYETWLLGFLHETYQPERLGFDVIDMGPTIMSVPEKLEKCLKNRDSDKPFYCQIGCKETHRPFDAFDEKPYTEKGITVPGYLEDGPNAREDLALMQAQINRLDRGLGEILGILEKHELNDNTIVVVTTDHGLALPHAKGTLYDSGVGVLLFMRYPNGNWRVNQKEAALISHVDVLPTLLESCQIDVPTNIQGRSFKTLLEGGPYRENEYVFTEKTHFHFYDPMRSVRDHQYCYIRNFEFCRQTEVLLDYVHQGAFKDLDNKYAGGHPEEELYDLQQDPDQLTNLAYEADYQEIKENLARTLANWMHQTNDPLINGPIPSPFYTRSIQSLFKDRY